MNRDQALAALGSRIRVRARYAPREAAAMTHAEGVVIGYTDAPTVCIETDSGERVWWRADLTETASEWPAPPERPAPLPDPVIPDTGPDPRRHP